MSRVNVAVAVADAALDRFHEVLAACRAHGFEADAALSGVGILVGSVHPSQVERLRGIAGVAAVERQRELRARSLARPSSRTRGRHHPAVNGGRWTPAPAA
jgi:hypothetical protein